MPEWGPLLFWPAYLYLAGCVAAALALLSRMGRPGAGRSLGGARWRVLLPPLAVLLLPLWTAMVPHSGLADAAMHRLWHLGEAAVHGSPWLHGLLHIANLALLLGTALSIARVVAAVSREGHFAAAVSAHGRRAGDYPDLPLYRLPAAQPLCFTLGWLRPRIYLSTSLEEQLEPAQLAAVLAHEREHTRRRDGLIGGALSLFYTLFPIPGSGLLLRDWRRAAERECDAAAAKAVGSRKTVARALLQAARLVVHAPHTLPGTAGFTGEEDVEERVAALLDPSSSPAVGGALWNGLAGALLLAAAPVLHHLAELLVHH